MKLFITTLLLIFTVISIQVNAQRRFSAGAKIGRTRTNEFGTYKARTGKPIGDMFRSNTKNISKVSSPNRTTSRTANALKNVGRSGRQPRLRALAEDHKIGRSTSGWFKQERNAVRSGKRSNMRMPPSTELAHPRGLEARHGNNHENSFPQAKELHKIQHRHDNNGKRQTQRGSLRK